MKSLHLMSLLKKYWKMSKWLSSWDPVNQRWHSSSAIFDECLGESLPMKKDEYWHESRHVLEHVLELTSYLRNTIGTQNSSTKQSLRIKYPDLLSFSSHNDKLIQDLDQQWISQWINGFFQAHHSIFNFTNFSVLTNSVNLGIIQCEIRNWF